MYILSLHILHQRNTRIIRLFPDLQEYPPQGLHMRQESLHQQAAPEKLILLTQCIPPITCVTCVPPMMK